MSHANARLTPAGRLLMVCRVEAGMPQVHVAAQMGLCWGTVAKWWHRYVVEGEAGLMDRSSKPNRSPRRTPARVEERVCRLRTNARRGPVYLGARAGVPASTVWRILCRNGLNRLGWIDGVYERTSIVYFDWRTRLLRGANARSAPAATGVSAHTEIKNFMTNCQGVARQPP